MYNTRKTKFGYQVRFSGTVSNEDMKDWWLELGVMHRGNKGKFAVLFDFRVCDYLGEEGKRTFDRCRKSLYHKGMKRSAILFKETNMANGFRRAAKRLGFSEWERYLSYEIKNCETAAKDWLFYAKDPDMVRNI